MNYYNPYFYSMPINGIATTPAKVGFLSKIFGGSGITLGGILNGTQRALNFVNQAIPLIKQVKPMVGNAKTMFKVMNEFKRTEKPKKQVINKNNTNNVNNEHDNIGDLTSEIKETTSYSNIDNGPTFFI